MSQVTAPARVVVIGAGLIGTSAALALRERGCAVWLSDIDGGAAKLAVDLGAGELLPDNGTGRPGPPPSGTADVAVLAVPPAAVAGTLAAAQAAGVAHWYTDTASVKALPLRQARTAGCDVSRYVPGHPLAGRERSGPAAARADLFLGRTWALCPARETAVEAVRQVDSLVRACGAKPVVVDADSHDRWVALVSHAPHVVAAAMAGRLAADTVSEQALALAGQGVSDATRVAAGDPALWTQILAANAVPVAEVLREVAADLAATAEELAELSTERLTALLVRGRAGVARLPGKHGGPAAAFSTVQVVIEDRPGELARLLTTAGQAGVNVEDVGIEHSPGLPVGVAELSVRPESTDRLIRALAADGWPVRR